MPDITFSIRIVDDDGEPCENISIYVSEKSILGGEGVSTKTNEDGWAEFTFHNLIEYWIDAEVYIGREEAIDFTFEDGDTTSFTYSHD